MDAKLFGMIHLPRLTFDATMPLATIVEYALAEGEKLVQAGFDAIMVENFNDVPFAKSRVSDLVLARMSVILYELRKKLSIEIGVNVLRNGCEQALTLATVHNCDYIRCNVWESAYVTDQGIIESAAHDVVRLKHMIRSNVKILADVLVKHAQPLGTASIVEAAKNVNSRGSAAGIIVSGVATGASPDLEQIEQLNAVGIYPIIGSGYNIEYIEKLRGKISGAIVGTSIKVDKVTTNPIDIVAAKNLVRLHKAE